MGCCQDWRHGSGCSADCPPPATAVYVASANTDAIHDRIAAAEKEIARLLVAENLEWRREIERHRIILSYCGRILEWEKQFRDVEWTLARDQIAKALANQPWTEQDEKTMRDITPKKDMAEITTAAPAPPDRDPLGELASAVKRGADAIHRAAEKLRSKNAPASSALCGIEFQGQMSAQWFRCDRPAGHAKALSGHGHYGNPVATPASNAEPSSKSQANSPETGTKNCDCYGAHGLRHAVGSIVNCEYYDHHCPDCHEEGRCTKAECKPKDAPAPSAEIGREGIRAAREALKRLSERTGSKLNHEDAPASSVER